MEIADQYFNNCREITVRDPRLMPTRVRYSIFAQKPGVVAGANKAVNFIKDQTYGPALIRAKKDGDSFNAGEPVMVYNVWYYETVTLETTVLGFLSFSGAATSMRKIVEAADSVPVIDMSARHYPWQIIEETALAAYLGGADGTSTQGGYNYVQKWYNPGDAFKLYASLPHAQAAVNAQFYEIDGLLPSVIAAKGFNRTYPDRPITVLVDYEGRELDVAKEAYQVFGKKLFAVRLDTHGGRNMQGTYSIKQAKDAINYLADRGVDIIGKPKYYLGNGVTIEAVYVMREFLDSIGCQHVKIVVSSGFNEEKVKTFKAANAPMDFIGTGSWVDFMMFTADITHVFENGQWVKRLKVDREHGPFDHLPIVFERI